MWCIFLTTEAGGRRICQALAALGLERDAAEAMELLSERYCTTGRFVDCPVFGLLDRALARRQIRLDAATCVAPVHAATSDHAG